MQQAVEVTDKKFPNFADVISALAPWLCLGGWVEGRTEKVFLARDLTNDPMNRRFVFAAAPASSLLLTPTAPRTAMRQRHDMRKGPFINDAYIKSLGDLDPSLP